MNFRSKRAQTSHNLLYIIQHKVHQRIVSLQSARTLPTAVELDIDLLVHVLAQVEDVLLARPLCLVAVAALVSISSMTAAMLSVTPTAATTTSVSPSSSMASAAAPTAAGL
jgi:hypothetical protein